MRTMILALTASLVAAGAAQAQISPSTDTALLEMRMRTEQNRLEADLRSQQAQQYRFQSQLESNRLQASTANPLGERLGTLQPADVYAEAARLDQLRRRTDAQRQQQVERRLQSMDR